MWEVGLGRWEQGGASGGENVVVLLLSRRAHDMTVVLTAKIVLLQRCERVSLRYISGSWDPHRRVL